MREGLGGRRGSGLNSGLDIGLDSGLDRALAQRGYRFLEIAGEGAFSRVYRVQREADGAVCACKVSRDRRQWEPERALLREIGQAGQGIFPRLYDSFEREGKSCLVMEYLDGQSLGELMRRRGRLSQRRAIEIGRRLAEGLTFLKEEKGVLYRDLNPENVRICQDGQVKLIDFGCICPLPGEERAEKGGFGRAGTPGYAAPEQLAEGGHADACSDVYALGRLLHYLVTGDDPCLPPRKKPPIRAYDRRLGKGLERLLEECIRTEKTERPPDMRRMLKRLCILEERGAGYLWGEWFGRRKTPEYFFEKYILLQKNDSLFR